MEETWPSEVNEELEEIKLLDSLVHSQSSVSMYITVGRFWRIKVNGRYSFLNFY